MYINKIYNSGYLIYKNKVYDYNDFNESAAIIKNESIKKDLCLIIEDKTLSSTLAILGSLIADKSVLLLDFKLAKRQLKEIIKNFKPYLIIGSKFTFDEFKLEINVETKYFCIKKIFYENFNPTLKSPLLLIGTSGSSGSTKFVGLTHENLYSNCNSISDYLNIDSNTITINNLPCSYSYGLSVLNSTMLKGGRYIISNEKSFIRKEFWEDAVSNKITDFSGVPTTYRTLIKLDIDTLLPKSLLRLTQAGGKLEVNIQEKILNLSNRNKFDFYIMYGQTEATARLTYLNLTKEPLKIGSVGRVIPQVKLIKPNFNKDSKSEELIFSGKNISLGYFTNLNDLEKSIDSNKGILKTGDLGFIDEDNCITITGRKSRFCKIDGKRISLESIELELLKNFTNIAVVSNDEKLYIASNKLNSKDKLSIKKNISNFCGINKIRISVVEIEIPFTYSGKVSYSVLLKNILKYCS